jgi:adenylosuccinate lyase
MTTIPREAAIETPHTTADRPEHGYRSPLETRNASRAMRRIWSEQHRFGLWRRIWLAAAETQRELGLDISEEAVAQMRTTLDQIDFESAARHEARIRHDVMAHVHAFGEAAPAARGVIHLGLTSQDVVCNAEVLQWREALDVVAVKLARVVDRLGTFAATHRDLPTLGFTHFQSAQPTTVGRRACLWAQDFATALTEIEHLQGDLRLKGLRGATGTQASYLDLFGGDATMVDRLEAGFAERLGFDADSCWPICGQTMPRLADARLLGGLALAAASIHKWATDLRLLAGLGEISEPIGRDQVGSSAMAYKRNPMRCERACGLSRFVLSLQAPVLQTAAVQWLERSLDDSSLRRLAIPEAFLALDGALDLAIDIAGGLEVHEAAIAARLDAELPFLATERLLMAAVARGADRQEAHEVIRRHSREAQSRRHRGEAPALLESLAKEAMFAGLTEAPNPSAFIGRSPEQVERVLEGLVQPIRSRYHGRLDETPELRV